MALPQLQRMHDSRVVPVDTEALTLSARRHRFPPLCSSRLNGGFSGPSWNCKVGVEGRQRAVAEHRHNEERFIASGPTQAKGT